MLISNYSLSAMDSSHTPSKHEKEDDKFSSVDLLMFDTEDYKSSSVDLKCLTQRILSHLIWMIVAATLKR
jgi:hypothetical protein